MTRAVRFVTDHYLVVPLGAILAVIWANTAPEGYFGFAQSLSFAVNEIGMALFVALVAQELIEAVMPGGALHTWQRVMLPVIAAVGGAIVAVLVYVLYLRLVGEVMLEQSWPAACAVDVAFSYFLARIVFRERAPVAFTLMLATASNVMILPFVAVRFPLAEAHASGAVLIVASLAVALAMRKVGVRTLWPYVLVCGPLAWFGFYWSGLHPALSPLLVVPFLVHTPRDLALFADASERSPSFRHPSRARAHLSGAGRAVLLRPRQQRSHPSLFRSGHLGAAGVGHCRPHPGCDDCRAPGGGHWISVAVSGRLA